MTGSPHLLFKILLDISRRKDYAKKFLDRFFNLFLYAL